MEKIVINLLNFIICKRQILCIYCLCVKGIVMYVYYLYDILNVFYKMCLMLSENCLFVLNIIYSLILYFNFIML